jgi:hypothetical protein
MCAGRNSCLNCFITVKDDFDSPLTGGAFIAAALMWWLGWMLLPVRIGTYFDPGVFGRIHEHFHYWIWMYRIHLFGMIMSVIALFALMALVADSPSRVLIWPGAAVASSGMIVSALGAAFYYHHGAWGSLQLAGKPLEAGQAFVEALRVDTEYVTCLVRFGRVFGGLGLVVLAWGLLRHQLLPTWNGLAAGIIGLSAMALTMGLPDHLSYYLPVFHALVLWLLATGVVIFRRGVSMSRTPSPGPAPI